MRSVVGITVGVSGGGVAITGSVEGTGVGTVVAGAVVPELVVQPEESTQSRITRVNIRILTRFIARGLLLIPISDLRLMFLQD
jgi:hypothetical protein